MYCYNVVLNECIEENNAVIATVFITVPLPPVSNHPLYRSHNITNGLTTLLLFLLPFS